MHHDTNPDARFGIDDEQYRLEMALTNMRLNMPRDAFNARIERIAKKHDAMFCKGGATGWSHLIVCKGGDIERRWRDALREAAS